MSKSRGAPILISNNNVSFIKRVDLGGSDYNEKWIQELIFKFPEIIPMDDIEPSFGDLIPVSMEIPCGHGFIDNLFVTGGGDIVLVETKLWRNPEMRRNVVAQALDYVAALSRMGYEAFQHSIARGLNGPSRLYDLVSGRPHALNEAQFIDTITRNIKRSKLLVIVLGDGVREETEALINLFKNNISSYFTFALVELSIGKIGDDIFVVPNILVKTVFIERNIIRIEEGECKIETVQQNLEKSVTQSIDFAEFMKYISSVDQELPKNLEIFQHRLSEIGIHTKIKKTALSITFVEERGGNEINLGYITKDGKFWTDRLSHGVPQHIWFSYLENISNIIKGKVRKLQCVVDCNDKVPLINEFIPRYIDDIIFYMEKFTNSLINK